LGVTFGIPWALLVLVCAQGAMWAWGLLAITVIMRVGVAMFVGKTVLRDLNLFRSLALLPLRDVIATLVWIVSFVGHRVSWRGKSFHLRDGKLEAV
jgi:ceramide glucosyltransferase